MSPRESVDCALLARAYLLLQAYAAVAHRALGPWQVRTQVDGL
jgi:hypothetical protein